MNPTQIDSRVPSRRRQRCVGIAAEPGGFELKHYLLGVLREAGYHMIDYGDHRAQPEDDYPDFVVPLARAVAVGTVDRGIALCGSGVGASIAASKVAGARACWLDESFAAKQGVEDVNCNIICLGGLAACRAVVWDLVQTSLAASFRGADRYRRRLVKIAALDSPSTKTRE